MAGGSEMSRSVAIALLFYGHCSASRTGFRDDAGQPGAHVGSVPSRGHRPPSVALAWHSHSPFSHLGQQAHVSDHTWSTAMPWPWRRVQRGSWWGGVW